MQVSQGDSNQVQRPYYIEATSNFDRNQSVTEPKPLS